MAFPLKLRVPGWCQDPQVEVNGETIPEIPVPRGEGPDEEADDRSYIVIDRTWNNGDRLTLTLPMEVRVTRWTGNRNTASVHLGPLTFSLKIGEQYVRAGGSDDWPAWEIHPSTAWNYGLVLDAENPTRGLEVNRRAMPAGQPFTIDAAPVEIKASAKKIPNWTHRCGEHERQGAVQRPGAGKRLSRCPIAG